ncbi:hypothetical protein CDEST_02657 [Colletotrichum destructivum]|uniref:Uncharacterized protein n=1 Tax=Colletotrichum destructivum TaxID=34406 RepID=A0AAX4I2Q1_9PEZI|nr:hypothetical protein CDEST_02657 [Colletotrichum destructivum]
MGTFQPMEQPSAEEVSQLRHNFTSGESSDEHLFRCWKHQDCRACLAESQCSWCPMVGLRLLASQTDRAIADILGLGQTSACVPNAYSIPLLAPAYNENICPHWAERWELRTKPLGCQVSTITSLTSIISIISTLLVVLLVALVVLGVRWGRRRSKQDPNWWRVWTYGWKQFFLRNGARDANGEQDPLLGHDHNARQEGTRSGS